MSKETSNEARQQPNPPMAGAPEPVRAAVRSLGWEGTRADPELIAWVRCWNSEEEWGLRFQVLPSREIAPVTSVGRPEVRFAGYAAVERYLGENPAELEWLLQFRPRPLRSHPPQQ
jgi:hypothetical protein